MNKRGQITSFMIIGFVVLVAFILLFVFRTSLLEFVQGEKATRNILSGKIDSIDHRIKNCIDEEINPALIILGEQGGTFNPISYRSYLGKKVSYLCYGIKDDIKCSNNVLTREELKEELTEFLYNRIYSCIDINSFRNDKMYQITTGDFNFDININDNNILFDINYPITLERKGIKVSIQDFNSKVDVPLGAIQQAVRDILEYESNFGEFDPVGYNLIKRSEFVVYVLKPYPDTIYQVKHIDSDYIFQFAVKGVSEHE